MADSSPLLQRRRQARDDVAGLRTQARWQVGLGLFWLLLASASWSGDVRDWVPWGWSALALGYVGLGLVSWRRFRRERARLAGLVGIDLRPVAETALSRLVAAALEGAAADEVTPRITPGEQWTPERVEWLRAFHQDRRPGLDGPHREATWAVVEVVGDDGPDAERVLGSVRLRRTGEPGAFETGIWLARDARRRTIGGSAMRLLLERAREAGAETVEAETIRSNVGAVSLLHSLGFRTEHHGERVRAELRLPSNDRTPGA